MANQITLHEEGPKTAQPPSGLHLQMRHCITEGLARGDEEQMLSSTSKMIYSSLSENLSTPRLVQEATDEEEVKRVLSGVFKTRNNQLLQCYNFTTFICCNKYCYNIY